MQNTESHDLTVSSSFSNVGKNRNIYSFVNNYLREELDSFSDNVDANFVVHVSD